MYKVNETTIGKYEQVVGLKVPVLRLYIRMYFAEIKFPSKESGTTQAFAFSRFRKQTPKSSSRLPCNLDTDYIRKTN